MVSEFAHCYTVSSIANNLLIWFQIVRSNIHNYQTALFVLQNGDVVPSPVRVFVILVIKENLFRFCTPFIYCLFIEHYVHILSTGTRLGKRPHSSCFTWCCFRDLFKKVVEIYNSTDTVTAFNNSWYISSEKSDLQMVINMTIAIYALSLHMLISFSVDEILLLKYMKWVANFWGLPLDEEVSLS